MNSGKVDGIIQVLPDDLKQEFSLLTENEKKLFIATVSDPEVLPLLYAIDFKEVPVSPREFFTNPYFVGEALVWNDKEKRGIYPKWLDELCYVLEPKNQVYEWILSGSLGAGKSTAAFCSQVYIIYWLNCLRNPHAYLGMLPSAPIEIFLFSITLTTAEDAGVSRLERIVNGSPYFRRNFPVNKRRRQRGGKRGNDFDYKLEFPPFLEIVEGSKESHFISRDIIGGVLDEANFVPQPRKTGALSYDATSRAFSLYTGLRNRIESRFMKQGKVFGLMCLISSAATRFDFLEQHKKHQRENGHAHISEFPLYGVKPWEYSGRSFFVIIGNERKNSKIIEESIDKSFDKPFEYSGSERIEKIPIEHLEAFRRDLPKALREISGVPSETAYPLIPDRDLIGLAADHSREHPFDGPVTISHQNDTGLEIFLKPQRLVKWEGNILVPKYHRGRPRHIHIDLSKNQCATGISMGCVCGYQESKTAGYDGKVVVGKSPIIWMDFSLQINPPEPPGEIDYSKIRYFIRYLRDEFHFPIKIVSFDGWQSVDSRQILLKEGFPEVEILSVDRDPGPYLATRSAVVERRILWPPYPPFEEELATLQLLTEGKNTWVEKPAGGLKDVSDSVAGVVWWCNEEAHKNNEAEIEAQIAVKKRQLMMPIVR